MKIFSCSSWDSMWKPLTTDVTLNYEFLLVKRLSRISKSDRLTHSTVYIRNHSTLHCRQHIRVRIHYMKKVLSRTPHVGEVKALRHINFTFFFLVLYSLSMFGEKRLFNTRNYLSRNSQTDTFDRYSNSWCINVLKYWE